jgi:hypothetical protein
MRMDASVLCSSACASSAEAAACTAGDMTAQNAATSLALRIAGGHLEGTQAAPCARLLRQRCAAAASAAAPPAALSFRKQPVRGPAPLRRRLFLRWTAQPVGRGWWSRAQGQGEIIDTQRAAQTSDARSTNCRQRQQRAPAPGAAVPPAVAPSHPAGKSRKGAAREAARCSSLNSCLHSPDL